jgi:hypothetical protein
MDFMAVIVTPMGRLPAFRPIVGLIHRQTRFDHLGPPGACCFEVSKIRSRTKHDTIEIERSRAGYITKLRISFDALNSTFERRAEAPAAARTQDAGLTWLK